MNIETRATYDQGLPLYRPNGRGPDFRALYVLGLVVVFILVMVNT